MTTGLSLEQIFIQIPLKVKKHKNYFPIYEEVLNIYRNQEVKVLEIGVLDGGSLLLWKRYLGSKAKVVGLDINPRALELNSSEFDIVIGDQGDKEVWQRIKNTYGDFDVIIDDGGHTNRQQIIALIESSAILKNRGKLIVEDVHCSYMPEFGNPSKYSFVNFAFKVIHRMNSRFFFEPRDYLSKTIHSVTFYESVIVFTIDRELCKINEEVTNLATSSNRGDHRLKNDPIYMFLERDIKRAVNAFAINNKLLGLLKGIKQSLIRIYLKLRFKIENFRLRKYFVSRN